MPIRDSIDRIFSQLAAGNLVEPINLVQDGWEVDLPSGRKVARSALQTQARALITLGPDAVPHLLHWVLNDNLALRYVAIYALEQITREKPYLPYFDQADHEEDRDRAIEVWRGWHEAWEQR